MNQSKRQEVLSILICLCYLCYFYLLAKFQYQNNWLLSLNSIHTFPQLSVRITFDFLAMLIFPLLILFRYRRKLSVLAVQRKNLKLCLWLLLTYLLFFLLHKDFSISGVYKAFFYLVIVAFSEEVIYRGYLYSCIKTSWRTKAIIISGALYGAMHAILPSILANKSALELLFAMVSQVGGGIIVGFIFISIMEKSQSIFVAILIHALMDYSYGSWGLIVLVLTFIYLYSNGKQSTKEATN